MLCCEDLQHSSAFETNLLAFPDKQNVRTVQRDAQMTSEGEQGTTGTFRTDALLHSSCPYIYGKTHFFAILHCKPIIIFFKDS